jgi:VanZ family protein
MVRLFFFFFSVVYVSVIFLFAGSPIVTEISRFNPYSLLHVPLYGILAVLLDRSFGGAGRIRFFLPGVIALGVAVADEVNQIFTPGREGSVTDVILDLVGISLFVLLSARLRKGAEKQRGGKASQV